MESVRAGMTGRQALTTLCLSLPVTVRNGAEDASDTAGGRRVHPRAPEGPDPQCLCGDGRGGHFRGGAQKDRTEEK